MDKRGLLASFPAIMLSVLMAPADKSGGGGAAKQDDKPNPWNTHFGAITFIKAKATEQTHTDEKTGRKSRKLADVILPIAGLPGAYIPGKINAVQMGNNKPIPEFIFFAAQNRGQCIKVEQGSPIEALLETFRDDVVAKYLEFRKTSGTDDKTTARQARTIEGLDSL